MQYIIVQGSDIADLAKTVTAHVEQGWQPQGGVSAAPFHQRDQNGSDWWEVWFFQALVK